MPDDPRDPRDRRAPVRGVPIRPITERGGGTGGIGSHDHRRKSEPLPVVQPFEVEEVTGVLKGADLKTARGQRSTEERLDRLETKQDTDNERLGKLEVAVADMGGQFKIIPRLVDAMEKATNALQQREHITFTTRMDVDKAQALSEVEIDRAEAITKAEIDKAEVLHKAEIRKKKWELLIKIAAILGAIGTAISTTIAAGC